MDLNRASEILEQLPGTVSNFHGGTQRGTTFCRTPRGAPWVCYRSIRICGNGKAILCRQRSPLTSTHHPRDVPSGRDRTSCKFRRILRSGRPWRKRTLEKTYPSFVLFEDRENEL